MASAISKRSQARNERALQDLIKTIPGNDRCADCFARNPGWASWSLGIFLCMRCAALHRKLGTHISKVKSLSMDAWSHDQVEQMKKTGNVASNRLYNPRNVKPNIPIDADEVDGVMERFIRQKYQHRNLAEPKAKAAGAANAQHTGTSVGSADDVPPQVPPKSPRFGASLRSSSSTYPIRPAEASAALPPRQDGDNKLKTLRDMGFPNESKNAQVLKGVGGDVSKAVETLVRLGEGSQSAQGRAQAANRQRPVVAPPRTESEPRLSSMEAQTRGPVLQMAGNHHPQIASITASSQGTTQPQYASQIVHNPFQASLQSAPIQNTLEQTFQNLSVSSPQQVMPHHTGSWSNSSAGPYSQQTNPFMKTFTPPMSPNPYHSTGIQQTFPYVQQQQQQQQHQEQQYRTTTQQPTNPFLRSSKSQNFALSNPFAQMQPAAGFAQPAPFQQPQPTGFSDGNSGYAEYPSSSFYQPMQQPQQATNFFSQSQQSSPFAQSPAPLSQQSTSQPPFDQAFQQHNAQYQQQPQAVQMQQFQQQQQQQQQQFQQQAQPLYPQATARYDKSSILALYNAPHLAPQRLEPLQENAQTDAQDEAAAPAQQPPNGQPTRSFTAPVAQTQNPFAKLMPIGSSAAAARLKSPLNRESVDFQGLQNGRHSPDAFRSLSARIG